MLVEGRHFFHDADPVSVGHKSLAVNLSDLAAMGARPRAFTLALALPQVDEDWLGGFCRGLFAIADRHACELVGGDTTRGPLTVCDHRVRARFRPGRRCVAMRAQPGDDIWVSGTLGAAALAVHDALRADRAQPPIAPLRASTGPSRGSRSGCALRHLARAAIDLSDGLTGDLGHILDRSRVGAELDWPALPVEPASRPARRAAAAPGAGRRRRLRTAVQAAPRESQRDRAIGRRLDLPLARIGRIVAGDGLRLRDARGRPLPVDAHGFDHFA